MARAVPTGYELLNDADAARRLYRTMVLIRRFEERTEEQYTRARIGGYCHLAIGEEASHGRRRRPARVSRTTSSPSYRDHGAALAVGSEPAAVMAELFGKSDGRRRRLRRLDAPARRRAPLPRRLGHRRRPPADRGGRRLRARLHGRRRRRALPVRRRRDQHRRLPRGPQPGRRSGTCRSSSRSSTTSTAWAPRSSRPRAEPELYRRAEAYGMHGERVDGNDVLAVREAAGRLLDERARSERRPSLLETHHLPLPRTLRGRRRQGLPHARGDRGVDRRHDPIDRYAARPEGGGAARRRRDRGGAQGGQRRGRRGDPRGRRCAVSRPRPTLYDNVYGDSGRRTQFERMGLAAPYGEREGTRAWRT